MTIINFSFDYVFTSIIKKGGNYFFDKDLFSLISKGFQGIM
jgi:hypothetical protein